jgi:hypothetical protein
MSEFNVRSDAIDVEQIMRQIRERIREKRGVDYTEAEIQQLAQVKLEKFLDPRGLRSDLSEQFRRREVAPSPPLPQLELKEFSIYGTHRGILLWIRKILQPILKLFVNPNPLVHFVWTQAHAQQEINQEIERWMRRREQSDAKMGPLYYEVLHNLVLELTRTGIDPEDARRVAVEPARLRRTPRPLAGTRRRVPPRGAAASGCRPAGARVRAAGGGRGTGPDGRAEARRRRSPATPPTPPAPAGADHGRPGRRSDAGWGPRRSSAGR